jgi:hypothetical protein
MTSPRCARRRDCAVDRPSLESVIAELRRLNEPVRRPRALPTEAEVRELEAEIGMGLPDDLRRFLLEASDVVDGVKEPVTVGTGDYTDIRSVLEHARHMGVPAELFPVCEDNGDFFCLTRSGEVVFWSHNGATDERWADLAAWIHQVWINRH